VDEPSEHIVELAHAAIEAGADVFVGHGPHLDRGIEVYQGKPVLYGLGNFIIQNDTVLRLPHESMVTRGLGHENTPADFYSARRTEMAHDYKGTDPHWQSAIAQVSFSRQGLREIRLHPIEFGYGLSRGQAGRPILAEGKEAEEVISRFQRLSAGFGTKVEADGETGTVRVG